MSSKASCFTSMDLMVSVWIFFIIFTAYSTVVSIEGRSVPLDQVAPGPYHEN